MNTVFQNRIGDMFFVFFNYLLTTKNIFDLFLLKRERNRVKRC